MAVTPAGFKILFPEFGIQPNARVQIFLDQADACVNNSAWGQRADAGIQYLAAHLIATLDGDESAAGSGVVTQKKVGEVSASYGFGQKQLDSAYASTKYGRIFVEMQRKVITARCL